MNYIQGKENLLRFAESCRVFSDSNASNPRNINHLYDIADETERLAAEGYVYLCLYGMSVSDNLWTGSVPVDISGFSEEEIDELDYDDEDEEGNRIKCVTYNFVKNPEGAKFQMEPKLREMVVVDRRGWCTP
jgi:hypothetical protein